MVATYSGSLFAINLEKIEQPEILTLYQEESYQAIIDFKVTASGKYAVVTVGEGELLIIKLNFTDQNKPICLRIKVSDIKLLNTFIVNEVGDSFDIYSANGRNELTKTMIKLDITDITSKNFEII